VLDVRMRGEETGEQIFTDWTRRWKNDGKDDGAASEGMLCGSSRGISVVLGNGIRDNWGFPIDRLRKCSCAHIGRPICRREFAPYSSRSRVITRLRWNPETPEFALINYNREETYADIDTTIIVETTRYRCIWNVLCNWAFSKREKFSSCWLDESLFNENCKV